MTSPVSQQTSIPATNTTENSATSYASAAGAPKKSSSQHPVVVGSLSSNSPAQNAKSASPSTYPVNGKQPVTRGSSNGHIRNSSLTMAATGPNSYIANGGPVGGAKAGIQFGFESPAMTHGTPQATNTAPIPIPGGNNQRVPSPAHSPSPIPQPSASGGRPPSGLAPASGQMTFGSLSSDSERHMRQGSMPGNPNTSGAHLRRDSTHSAQSDHAGRGNFVPQGGRGRGFNPNYNNQMGYPPNNQFRNSGQGRGMPPSFQPQQRNMAYPNSPQPNHRSPALAQSIPGTPNMPAVNMPNVVMQQTPPQHHYAPPANAAQYQAPTYQTYGYPPGPIDAYGRPHNFYMGVPPQASSPGFNPGFGSPYVPHHGQSMSRTSSQQGGPPASTHAPQTTPMGTNKQLDSPGSTSFVKPKKSAAIIIKSATGEVLDTASFKVPSSPAASSQNKTPSVAGSSSTPPPKSSTLAPDTADPVAPKKSTKEIQNELREKVLEATRKRAAEVAAAAAHATPAESKPEATPEPVTPKVAEVFEKKIEDAPAAKEEETIKKTEEPAKEETEDEYMERMIREMEEADAKREKEQAELTKKIAAEKVAAKAKADADANTPEAKAAADKKLREQEREMERLEEEKEKKRRLAEQSGKTLSVADLLAGKTEPSTAKVEDVADKLAGMKIAGDKTSSTAEKRGAKPAALNLAPLNTKTVEPPQPSAALQSLQSARFLSVINQDIYPEGIKSPNPALNAAVAKKGKTFKYDATFLLQFQKVFTEQPSLEFGQQVKQLIGDNDRSASRGSAAPRQGSRGGSNTPFTMGSFSGPAGARTLPVGTSSADRFAMSSGALARPGAQPMNSFQRPGGAFPMATPMSRNSSQTHMGPNSPRQSSRSTRGSRRGDTNVAKEAQAAKTMPLTAGMEIKPIAVSANGWKPLSLSKGGAASSAASGHLDPEVVQRKVKAALNKMTPENFERISDQILVIASQSKDETDGRTLRQVIQLTFEKATDEAHWASMYAKFCKKMLDTMSPEIQDERIKDKNGNVVSGGALFRKYLLNRCQEEFERGWQTVVETTEGEDATAAAEAKAAPGEVTMLSDEYYKAAAAKRRGLGLVQFIGELYKLGMLTERIMLECVHKLVDHKGVPDEAEIESLSKLLRTIGGNLDMSEKGRPMMDAFFGRIGHMIETPELPSRMKFMLMDVVDLRKVNWHSKEQNKGPKTLDEVRAEAEAAQAAKAQEAARTNSRGGGGRPGTGRGDARNFSTGYQQQPSNQIASDDMRRLKGAASRTTSGTVSLGPAGFMNSRSNSRHGGLGPGTSLGRRGEDSGNSSRTGTPGPTSNFNAFHLLANMDSEGPTSPPTTAASPALSKAALEGEKKDE